MRGLKGKVIVIAGGGSGIGAATADRLGEERATVVVADIHAENARAVATRVSDRGGIATAAEFDIADAESVGELVQSTVNRYGALHAVHVNAADLSPHTLGRDSDVLSLPMEVFDRTMAVNLRGHVLMTRSAIPALLAGGGGSIVYTASAAAFGGGAAQSAYSMAKSGLLALSRHVAFNWGPRGIRSNIVAPGLILTEGVLERNADGKLQERLLSTVRSPRLGQPADIAAAVAFLLSDDAAWINGQVISIDGGSTMR